MPASNRRQVTLEEVLEAHAFGILGSIYKVMPGLVREYTPGAKGKSPATVDVEVAVHDVRLDTETGERVPEPWPILAGVPVGRVRMGRYVIAAPLAAGDTVLLLSFDLDPTAFRATGHPADPLDTRRHGGGHWIALPFDLTDPGACTDPGNDLVVGDPDGVQVRINGSGVAVGAAAPSDAAALASKVDANMSALKDFATALGTIIDALGLNTSTPTPTSTFDTALGNFKAAIEATGSGTVKITP